MSNLPPPPPTGGPPPPPPGAGAPPPPGNYGGQIGYGGGPKPDSYLVWAILSTLLCCLPLGIVSIVFAAQVDGKYNAGDYAGAQAASEKAKNFAIGAAAVGVVVIILWVVVAAAGSNTTY